MNKMPQKPKVPAKIGTNIKRAIRLDGTKGSYLADIKRSLASVYQMSRDMPDSKNIKAYLKNAVEKGDLLKLDNGKYKLKETTRRRISKSRSRGKSGDRSRSKKRSGDKRRSRSGSKNQGISKSGKRRKRSSSAKKLQGAEEAKEETLETDRDPRNVLEVNGAVDLAARNEVVQRAAKDAYVPVLENEVDQYDPKHHQQMTNNYSR